MNEIRYLEIREESDSYRMNAALKAGWHLIEIFKRKRSIPHSDPHEFEEYPIYIVGWPAGSVEKISVDTSASRRTDS